MKNKYNIHVMDWITQKDGSKLANNVYIERVDNALFICQGIYICYDKYLELSNYEKNSDYTVINQYDNIHGGIYMLVADRSTGINYIVDRPL